MIDAYLVQVAIFRKISFPFLVSYKRKTNEAIHLKPLITNNFMPLPPTTNTTGSNAHIIFLHFASKEHADMSKHTNHVYHRHFCRNYKRIFVANNQQTKDISSLARTLIIYFPFPRNSKAIKMQKEQGHGKQDNNSREQN